MTPQQTYSIAEREQLLREKSELTGDLSRLAERCRLAEAQREYCLRSLRAQRKDDWWLAVNLLLAAAIGAGFGAFLHWLSCQ